MRLEVGSTMAGYCIEGLLGQGGMGVVYEARQLALDRVVALKVLSPELSADESFRERFRNEGLIQARIDHPNIVPVFEAGEFEGALFLSMRLVRGSNLKDLITARELEAGRTLRLLVPVAEALDLAHESGLTHRDVKPQNILVGAHDHAFLADFGLTKGPTEQRSLTRTGQFVGTLDYVSPEQIRGEEATARSDVYSIGAVLYECLTGVVPFPKQSDVAVLFAHMSDDPPRVSDQRPDLPTALDEVLARAMAKNPAERQETASELMVEAERAFGRRIRAAITPPLAPEVPEEAGIRRAEEDVSTLEARVRRSPAEDTPSTRPAATVPAPAPAETRASDAPVADAEPGPADAGSTEPSVEDADQATVVVPVGDHAIGPGPSDGHGPPSAAGREPIDGGAARRPPRPPPADAAAAAGPPAGPVISGAAQGAGGGAGKRRGVIAAAIVLLIAAVGVALAMTVLSGGDDDAQAVYRGKLNAAMNDVVRANRSVSSALERLRSRRSLSAERAVARAQSATASARGAINALTVPAGSEQLAANARQTLSRETAYLAAVGDALADPGGGSPREAPRLAANLTDALDVVAPVDADWSQGVSGADNLSAWARRNVQAAQRARSRRSPTRTARRPAATSTPAARSTPAPVSGSDCGGGVRAGPNTSCAFAFNVRDAYYEAPGAAATVEVYSPTTGRTYTMNCNPAGSGITCSGGNNASVSFGG